jgi:hypothetical protein
MIFMQPQRGIGAVIFAALIALLAIGVLLTVLSGKSAQNQFDEKTLPVLAVARQALITYAAGNVSAPPGRLPCPDTNNDGLEDVPCGSTATNQLGRLPWKTLGLPDLRDGSGECLWYAVSASFKDNPLSTGVNSDTPGQLVITDGGFSILAGNAIAVILAPGPQLPGQDRTSAGTTQCGGNTTASNYLDTVGAINNAAPTATTFATAQPSSTFNDRLVYITPAQFFPAVERRVAGEIKKVLLSYYNTPGNNYFPFAADATFTCTPLLTRGRLPAIISVGCPGLADWTLAPPGWFTSDNWSSLTYYTVASACTSPFTGCTGPGGLLTVNGGASAITNAEALVIEPGPALPLLGQTPPCASPNCLDGTNQDGDDIYLAQPASANFNDVVVIVAP